MLKVFIAGDISPSPRDRKLFETGQVERLFDSAIRQEISEADYAIANLETPIIDEPSPIEKSGACFGSKRAIVSTLKNVGFNILNVGNNHINDHGPSGIITTIDEIRANSILALGAGIDLAEASKPLILEKEGVKLSLLSYCEHEFSITEPNLPGANPVCLIDFHQKIEKLREESDLIVMLYHGGRENYSYPTPNQQRLCKHFISSGVDIVVCQHSHRIGAIESHEGGVIFYGQGNFLFDPYPIDKEHLYKGLGLNLNIKSRNEWTYELTYLMHRSREKGEMGIRVMNPSELVHMTKEQNEINRNVKDELFVQQIWQDHCNSVSYIYMSILNGKGKWVRRLFSYFPVLYKAIYRGKRKVILSNVIRCETHREILETILKSK